jgi:hypothetical protein
MEIVNTQIVDCEHGRRAKHPLLTPDVEFLLRHAFRNLVRKALYEVSESRSSVSGYEWNGEQI